MYIAFKLHRFRVEWVKNNSKNFTTVNNIFDTSLVEIGDASYGELNIVSFSNKCKLHVGRFVSIAQEVAFILDAEHYTNHASTYPYKVKYLRIEESESFGKGDIWVEDDVWIGYRATIMSGTHIGKGAVIAAGSIVTKDVPAYAIVGGVPAKIIKYRFKDEVCDALKKLNYEKMDRKFMQEHLELFYTPINKVEQVQEIIKLLETKSSDSK